MKIASLIFSLAFFALGSMAVFAQSPTETPTPSQEQQEQNQNQNQQQTFTVTLEEQNGSGVTGQATITQNSDGSITVSIQAQGLEANQVHPQHIHGFEDGTDSSCATSDLDQNGDGLVSLEEGQSVTGPAMLSLEPFPTADNESIDFEQTYSNAEGLMPLENRVLELHGMTVDGEYQQSLPVACGEITSGGQGGAPADDVEQDTTTQQQDGTTMPNGAPNTGFKGK